MEIWVLIMRDILTLVSREIASPKMRRRLHVAITSSWATCSRFSLGIKISLIHQFFIIFLIVFMFNSKVIQIIWAQVLADKFTERASLVGLIPTLLNLINGIAKLAIFEAFFLKWFQRIIHRFLSVQLWLLLLLKLAEACHVHSAMTMNLLVFWNLLFINFALHWSSRVLKGFVLRILGRNFVV